MKKLFVTLLAALLALTLCAGAFAADDIDSSKKVSKVEIGKEPNKTAYVIGDTFTMEGGTLIITYSDGSTKIVEY